MSRPLCHAIEQRFAGARSGQAAGMVHVELPVDEVWYRARLAMQIPDREKVGRCDYVIDNTGSLQTTRALVEKTYQELVRFSSSTPKMI